MKPEKLVVGYLVEEKKEPSLQQRIYDWFRAR